MKNNTVTIRINRPVVDVFLFTITPPNSTRWIETVVKEETSEWSIQVGTVYTLQDKQGESSKYSVTQILENELFELVAENQNYHVRYMYRKLDENSTELEYHEWVEIGEIEEPFTKNILEKLKRVLESA